MWRHQTNIGKRIIHSYLKFAYYICNIYVSFWDIWPIILGTLSYSGKNALVAPPQEIDGWMEGFYVLYFSTKEGLIGQPGTMKELIEKYKNPPVTYSQISLTTCVQNFILIHSLIWAQYSKEVKMYRWRHKTNKSEKTVIKPMSNISQLNVQHVCTFLRNSVYYPQHSMQ